jgi:hypothetical protein
VTDAIAAEANQRRGSPIDGGLHIAMIAPPWFEVSPRGYGGIELLVYWLVNGCARAATT